MHCTSILSVVIGFVALIFNCTSAAFAQGDYELPGAVATVVDLAPNVAAISVQSSSARKDAASGIIYTDYVVAVNHWLKGNGSDTVIISALGGEVDGEAMIAMHTVNLRPSMQAVVALKPVMSASDGLPRFRIVGEQHGLFLLHAGTGKLTNPLAEVPSVDILANYLGTAGALTISVAQPGAPMPASPPPSLAVTSFWPDTITAGTGSTLSIIGYGFGNTQGTGKVEFLNASSVTFNYWDVEPDSTQYLYWSDTLIQVEVPSLNSNSAGFFGAAGSGVFFVTNDQGSDTVSPGELHIPFAQLNLEISDSIVRPSLANISDSGGYVFGLSSVLDSAIGTNVALRSALETWKCQSFVSWELDSAFQSALQPASDSTNLICFDTSISLIWTQGYAWFNQCNGDWYLREVDLGFNPNTIWNYAWNLPSATEADFESFALRTFGFPHLLINNLDSNSVLYFDQQLGVSQRMLGHVDQVGADFIVQYATSGPNCGPGLHTPDSSCTIFETPDVGMLGIFSPSTSSQAGPLIVRAAIINHGNDTVTQAQLEFSNTLLPTDTKSWVGTLAPGDTSGWIVIGQYTFQQWGNLQDVTIRVLSSNGAQDANPANDTTTNLVWISATGAYNVAVHPPSYELMQPASCTDSIYPLWVFIQNKTGIAGMYHSSIIRWRVNGQNMPRHYLQGTGPGTSPDTVYWDTLFLGYYASNLVADHIEVWVEEPGGGLNINPGLDSVINLFPMNGTYTVGGPNPDFNTFSEAASNLSGRGVCGAVTINVWPGIYNEIAIFRQIPGASAINTITVQSATGVASDVKLIGHGGIHGHFRIQHTNHITFRNFTIETTAVGGAFDDGAVVRISGGAVHTKIVGCRIVGSANASYGIFENNALVNVLQGCDSTVIDSCTLLKGSVGVYSRGQSTFMPFSSGLFVTNSVFKDKYTGIFVRMTNNVDISHNVLYDSLGQLQSSHNPIIIESVDSTDFQLFGNVVYTDYSFGIRIRWCDFEDSNRGLIGNNMIVGNATAALTIEGANFMDMFNNTIAVAATAFRIYDNPTAPNSHLRIFNNLFRSENVHAVHCEPPLADVVDSCDHNAFYSNYQAFAITGPWAGAMTMADWQLVTGGQAMNSIELEPTFLSNIDAHLANVSANCPLIGAGTDLAGLLVDIDGTPRSMHPTIGAHELSGPALPPTQVQLCSLLVLNAGAQTSQILWSTGDTTQTITVASPGTYFVTAERLCGITTDSIEVVPAFSIANNLLQHPSCGNADGIIEVGASGGAAPYSFTWSDSAATFGPIVNGIAAGSYSVTVADSLGCVHVASYILEEPDAPFNSIYADSTLCNADSTGNVHLVVPNASYSFLWSNGSTQEDLLGVAAGTYTVTLTDVNNCTSVTATTVGSPTPIEINFDVIEVGCDPDLFGGSVLAAASGGAPGISGSGYGYLWSTGASTDSITGLGVGTYSLVVTDGNGCAISDSVEVDSVAPMTSNFLITNSTTGTDGSILVDVDGGEPPYTYQWQDGSSGTQLNGLGAGDYSLTVTDSEGCISVFSYTVSGVMGIEIGTPVNRLRVYPNPSSEHVYITTKCEAESSPGGQLKVFNCVGQLMLLQDLAVGKSTSKINVSTWPEGSYFVVVHSGGPSESSAFVVQRSDR